MSNTSTLEAAAENITKKKKHNPGPVARLRRNGFKIRVLHQRIYNAALVTEENPTGLDARGGQTQVDITTPDGKTASGFSYCLVSDNYNKREGRMRALKDAFNVLKK